ncbi:hypothetical protein BAE44_0019923, partial [Dichanthelium oligosanthes]
LALRKLFEDGVVKREDLFITLKLWPGNHAPKDVQDIGVDLEDFLLDYLDLYLVISMLDSLSDNSLPYCLSAKLYMWLIYH